MSTGQEPRAWIGDQPELGKPIARDERDVRLPGGVAERTEQGAVQLGAATSIGEANRPATPMTILQWRRRSARLWMIGGLLAVMWLLGGGRRLARGIDERAWRAIEEFGCAVVPLLVFALIWLLTDSAPASNRSTYWAAWFRNQLIMKSAYFGCGVR